MKRIRKPSIIRKFVRDDRGAALIEFALSFPIVVLATLIVFDVGLVTARSSTLNTAARDAARYASARSSDNLLPVTVDEIEAYAMEAAVANAADAVTVTITPPASYDADEYPIGFVSGATVEIELTADHQFLLASFLGIDPIQLTGRAELTVV